MHPVRILLTKHMPVNEYPEKLQVCILQDLNNQYLCFINKFCDLHLCVKKRQQQKTPTSISINFLRFRHFDIPVEKTKEQRVFRKGVFPLYMLSCLSK